jgi:hypothetical protein
MNSANSKPGSIARAAKIAKSGNVIQEREKFSYKFTEITS